MNSRSQPLHSISSMLAVEGSSFYGLLREVTPQALPIGGDIRSDAGFVHGTTVFAMHIRDGVVMAGDRRATSGNLIAQRDLRKLEPADSHSCIAFAGSAGFGLQLVRVFQLELQHYEKLEGVALSFPGKVSRLSAMVRDRLAQAMQGFAAVPVFAGWDVETARSHVVTFDVSGSPADETDYGGTGSGWYFAKGSLKKGYRPGLGRDDGVRLALQALADAADEDTATGGPDLIRRLYPTVAVITADGYEEVPDEELAELSAQLTV